MDITINGNFSINGNVNLQKAGSAEEDFNGLLDNKASFKELLEYLQKRTQGREPEKDKTAEEEQVLVKAKRRPGSEQLRNGHKLIARISDGEMSCEVYRCGYAVYDNGDRKVVVWIPDCLKAARYYSPTFYDERCKKERRMQKRNEEADPESERIIDGTEPGEDRLTEEQLAEMVWYLAVVIAGENQIEYNLERPISDGTRSDRYVDDDENPRFSWSCGAYFQNPEDEVIWKEERAERYATLTENQQEVYRMYYLEELSQEEIGDILGVSHQAVCRVLERIKKRIVKYYTKL